MLQAHLQAAPKLRNDLLSLASMKVREQSGGCTYWGGDVTVHLVSYTQATVPVAAKG